MLFNLFVTYFFSAVSAISCAEFLNESFFDVSITSNILGIAITSITANITITASNYINVNAFLFFIYPPYSCL